MVPPEWTHSPAPPASLGTPRPLFMIDLLTSGSHGLDPPAPRGSLSAIGQRPDPGLDLGGECCGAPLSSSHAHP